ncbi:hypothetical protein FGG08_000964 [Glutinoglossum americanum]|uniref:Uncharacterized protein n=1 Tax=Glutinoglossum americanum TaxID=1670608 RepID=A0A9P8I7W3_9PEZI|nr:hypothetical protein FGG08_000964 [Glutinoglossum americanum]
MSPTNPYIVYQLRYLVYYHLDNHLHENALFLAERLHAYEPRSADSWYLLALCHLRLGQLKAAYEYGRTSGTKGAHLGCAYVFAEACRGLGRPMEGIGALERNKHSESSRRHLPDAAAVYCLLGKLWHSYDDIRKAVDCYVEALKLNPFMWDAFLGLCNTGWYRLHIWYQALLTTITGASIRIQNIFKMTPEMAALLSAVMPSGIPPSSQTSSDESNNGPLQSNRNNNNPNHLSPHSDLFSLSSSRTLNHDGNPSGLFQKFNESSSSGINGSTSNVSLSFEGLGTPTGPGAGPDVSEGVVAVTTTLEPPRAPMRKTRTLQGLGLDFSIDAPPKMRPTSSRSRNRARGGDTDDTSDSTSTVRNQASTATAGERKRTISGAVTHASSAHVNDPTAVRRSIRLFNQIRPTSNKLSSSIGSTGPRESREVKKVKATGTKGRTGPSSLTVGRVVSGNRKYNDETEVEPKDTRLAGFTNASSTGAPKPIAQEIVKQEEALQWLLDLFKKLGSGYFTLTHFQSHDALQIFNSITAPQRETPWVLAQIARAHHELSSYAEAEKYFLKVRAMASTRMEDMEVFSTVLWHQKKDVDLAFLAHELIEQDRLSPQAWCAIGNSFSVQREHDQAIKCFKRATQLDPKFAYGFTLQGHEHTLNEEYDKALAAYRSAIAAESRHYNGWYGLGKVYEKLGKYDVAEKHFRTAAAINPTNAVLICCIGMIMEKLKNPRAALLQYAKASELQPRSAHLRYKKARVLMQIGELEMAHVELTAVKDMAPDEAIVHFLLGKLYKMIHQKANAIKHFTIALNLDPKASRDWPFEFIIHIARMWLTM